MQNETNQQATNLKASVNGALGTRTVTLSELERLTMGLAPLIAPDLSEIELRLVIDELEQQRLIFIPGPDIEISAATHKPWLDEVKSEIEWTRWEAYRLLLSNKSMPPKVLDEMHRRNDKILDLAGNPASDGTWARRGLVIGDVQSGKTANYLALFNKAADAGFKVFILLAGNTDKLRQQTQSRVDEGFIGRDTKKHQPGSTSQDLGLANKIGIGKIADIRTNNLTTFNRDFAAGIAGTVFHLSQDSAPTVFVIKKNKTILKNLATWLKNSNSGNKIQYPVLLLDDEADYASINTNQADVDATAINQGIRDLLGAFERNSYIGFTATPFANVLIDEENQEDLYPRNFIYSLESPSNYFGPSEMFREDEGEPNLFIEELTDGEEAFPYKHKSDLEVTTLPATLKEAVRVFFLTNAIRDLRPNQATQPRSMLINVSRFVKVQHQTFDLLTDFVANTRDALRYEKPNSSKEWVELREVFSRNFKNLEETWDMIEAEIPAAIEDIKVHVVNSRNKADTWESVYEGPRARVIAVGGDVLSRGLTLEGLSTSYFYRRSLAYDTLMQMGRWFGYRDGYKDLCRLWIDDEVRLWYRDIAEAIQELRDDLAQMSAQKLEPSQFGLAVRCHPGAMLMVTARNKARASDKQPKAINVRDIFAETSRIDSGNAIEHNWVEFKALIGELLQHAGAPAREGKKGRAVWLKVEQGIVGRFLGNIETSPLQTLFNDKSLSNFISSNVSPRLAAWDIVVMAGDGRQADEILSGLHLVQRKVNIGPDRKTLYFGGDKMRLGGTSDLGITLETQERAEIQALSAEAKGKQVPAIRYRERLKRPLMLIYPVEVKVDKAEKQTHITSWSTYVPNEDEPPLLGISIAFPKTPGELQPTTLLYQVGSVWQRLNSIALADFDEPTDLEESDEDY